LRFQGPTPELALARFNDKSIPLTPLAEGAFALLGTDLDLTPGRYPVVVEITSAGGHTSFLGTSVEIFAGDYPEERLTLPPDMVSPKDPKILARISQEGDRIRSLFGETTPGLAARRFAAPVPDPVGSPFGLRRILNGRPKSPHAGLDFRSPRGRQVLAPAPGTVVLTDDLYFTGKTVILDHGEGLFSLFAHLDRIECQPGQSLTTGDLLGRVGSTGRSTGPHLHWSIRLRGDRVDPASLLREFY
jgi:murein DD-endopeptidase MepM/ murein hydrolase activator NlpD